MKKALTYIFLTSILFLTAGLPVHARGLESRVADTRIIESNPKNVITTSIEVTNTTDERMECVPKISLPAGWKPITSYAPFWLERRQTSVILVGFYIPDDAPAKNYELDFYIASTHDPSISTHQSLLVKVLPVTGLKVRLVDSPRRVISGQEYTASFLIINESNQEEHISLSYSSSDDFPFVPEAREIVLGPGGSRTLSVRVQTREIERTGLTHRILCKAFLTRKKDIRAEAHSLVEIIPLKAREEIYHTIPAIVRTRGTLEVNDKTTSSVQGELEGEGTLDEEGKHSVSFLFRGPDTLDKSLSGTREHYALRTWGRAYDLSLGDKQFALSELTEQYLSARGADGLLAYKGVTLRGYRANSFWVDPKVTQTAASLGYEATEGNRFSVNGLSKNMEGSYENDEVLTAAAELKPVRSLTLQLEGGVGKHLKERDNAYLAKLSFLGDTLASRIKYMYCAPDFPGYYQDKELFSLDLSGQLTDSLNATATFNRETTNLDMDTLDHQGGLDTLYQTGLNYRQGRDTTYTLTWQFRTSEDRMSEPVFDYSTQTLRAGVLQNYSILSMNLFGEAGRKDDRLTSLTEFIYQVSSSMYLRLSNSQTYGGYFRFSQGQNAEIGMDRNITAGLTGSLPVMKDTRLNCTGQVDTYSDSTISNKYLLASSLAHSCANGSTLSLQASHTFYEHHQADSDDETSILLEYSYPFNLPVGRKRGTSSVSGIIRDALTGKALANVLVRVEDMTTATGADGRFMFSSIKPGVSYLTIDTSRLGLDLIPTCQNPLPITVEGGQEKTLDIGIIKKATLTGRVVLYGTGTDKAPSGYESNLSEVPSASGEKAPEFREISGLEHVLVELASATETMRVLTDSQGRFRFNEVRPGVWTILISTETLPAYHSFDKNNTVMKLDPGQTQDIFIKALPRKRSIRIIEHGDTIIQEKAKKK